MSCQPATSQLDTFETRIILTENQMREMDQRVRRIEDAKTLVCGIPSVEAQAQLRVIDHLKT
jgi:hypothetical protein